MHRPICRFAKAAIGKPEKRAPLCEKQRPLLTVNGRTREMDRCDRVVAVRIAHKEGLKQ